MSSIKAFKISVPDSALASLKSKLDLATFPDEWKNGFDWREQEAKLNELPHFTTKVDVDGFEQLDMHFVHQKGKEGSIPLLFVHGWPGSFVECAKLLPILDDNPGGPSFHLVAPSLPNFGFSEGASKPGFGIPQYAEAVHKVMLQLGYDQYVTQGGDWGYIVIRTIGLLYPSHCRASHLNFVRANSPSLTKNPLLYLRSLVTPHTAEEKAGLARSKWFTDEGFGYNLEQATTPNSIGLALTDSPVGLLAWIYEKLHDWTDAYPWTDDEILTWVSIYQFSRAGPGASARIYYEALHSNKAEHEKAFEYIPGVKLGLAYFPKDIVVLPRLYGRTLGPVVLESVHKSGGHFGAWERPQYMVDDLKKMFGKGGGADGIVKGR